MSRFEDTRILVVGAGPTGLTAALELARRGARPRVVDRNEGPTALSRAVGIAPHSLELLEPSGASERLLDEGLRIRGVEIRSGLRRIGWIRLDRIRHRYAFLLALPQRETERAMVERLAELGVAVERHCRLASLQRTAGGVEVGLETARGRREERFDVVIGADGAGSAVRESLGLPFSGYDRREPWSIADFRAPHWPFAPDRAQVFFDPRGTVCFVIAIGPGRFRAVANSQDAVARIPVDPATLAVQRVDVFRIAVRQAPRYQGGAVYLAGDAAHVHAPAGARGMNVGIEDACTLAALLAAGDASAYTRMRHPAGARAVRLSERLVRMAAVRGPLARALRAGGLGVLSAWPPLQRPLLAEIGGLA